MQKAEVFYAVPVVAENEISRNFKCEKIKEEKFQNEVWYSPFSVTRIVVKIVGSSVSTWKLNVWLHEKELVFANLC